MFLGDYYISFYPKFDKLTGEPIPFKTAEQYLRTDFRHKKNMYKWLSSCGHEEAKNYCESVFLKHCEEHELKGKFAPNHLYLLTHPRLPKLEYFYRFTNYRDLCKRAGLSFINYIEMEEENPLLCGLPKDICIIQDTREQRPILFDCKTTVQKLDFGDYSFSGEYYNYIFVDRKSEDDFKGTMSAGHERFRRELDRAKNLGSYVFVVIESDMSKIYQNNNLWFKKASNLDYVWENMRQIILDYSDVCQFIFTSNRENSKQTIPATLWNGNNLKNVDVQYSLEKFKWLG